MRRVRKNDELALDPNFHWRVAFLLGRIEQAAWALKDSDDPERQRLGQRLGDTVEWFFEEDPGG